MHMVPLLKHDEVISDCRNDPHYNEAQFLSFVWPKTNVLYFSNVSKLKLVIALASRQINEVIQSTSLQMCFHSELAAR